MKSDREKEWNYILGPQMWWDGRRSRTTSRRDLREVTNEVQEWDRRRMRATVCLKF